VARPGAGACQLHFDIQRTDASSFTTSPLSAVELASGQELPPSTLPPIGDDGLVHLLAIPELEGLSLDATAVTDAGLVHLRPLKAMRWLGLSHTRITDDGLRCIMHLTELEALNLSGTEITDGALWCLRGMSHL
jgi:hypothetical protein